MLYFKITIIYTFKERKIKIEVKIEEQDAIRSEGHISYTVWFACNTQLACLSLSLLMLWAFLFLFFNLTQATFFCWYDSSSTHTLTVCSYEQKDLICSQSTAQFVLELSF